MPLRNVLRGCHHSRHIAGSGWLALAGVIAHAQPVPAAPPQASPGVLQEQLRRLAPDSAADQKAVLPPVVPAVRYPEGADARRVTVSAVQLSGNTVIPTEALSPAWSDIVGKEVPVTALYDLAFALSATYRNRGYVLSSVVVEGAPEANGLPNGVLRLRAVEGRVTQVVFDPELAASARIRAEAQVIAQESPLTIKTFERQMLIINDIPGVSAKAYLEGLDTPGDVRLTLTVARSTVTGMAGVQNRVSDLLGNVLIEGRVSINNAFGLDEGQSLLLQTTDKARLKSVGYAYDQPLGTSGLTFNGFLAHIESKSSLTEADIAQQSDFLSTLVRSKSDVATFGVSYPLLRSRTQSLRLRARFNIYDGQQEGDLFGFTQKERVRALRLGAGWDLRDTSGVNFADAEFSQGLSGLGSTSSDATDAIRTGAKYNFSKLNYQVGRLQQLGGPFSLLGSVQGQWTNDRLPSSERFALGGEVILRAFDAGDLIGDRGYAGKLELRYEPALIPGGQIAFYGYAEYGRTTSLEIAPVPNTVMEGISSGIGVRGTLQQRLNFYAEVSVPALRNPSSTNSRKARFFAGLSYQF